MEWPWRYMTCFIAGGVLVGCAGVGCVWLLITVHLLAPDNLGAAAAIGAGGGLLGLILGGIAGIRAEERHWQRKEG